MNVLHVGVHSSEKLRFDVYTVCLVYADELPKGFNFRMKSSEAPKQDDVFYFTFKLKTFKTLI